MGFAICLETVAFALTSGLNVNANNATEFNGVGSTVLGYIQWFGYTMAVGMLLYIGIKYMMASANDKAELKKGAINYVIGAIVIAAATTIVGIPANIGVNLSGSSGTASGAGGRVYNNQIDMKY